MCIRVQRVADGALGLVAGTLAVAGHWIVHALRALALLLLVPAGFALAGERRAVAGVVLSQFAGWPTSLHLKREQGLLRWSTESTWLLALAAGLLLGAAIDAGLR